MADEKKRPTPPPDQLEAEYHRACDDIHTLRNSSSRIVLRNQMAGKVFQRLISNGFEKCVTEEFKSDFELLKKFLST